MGGVTSDIHACHQRRAFFCMLLFQVFGTLLLFTRSVKGLDRLLVPFASGLAAVIVVMVTAIWMVH